VGGDVPVDSEASVVTSLISRSVGSVYWTRSLRDAHRLGCACVHGVSVCMYVWASMSILHFTKKTDLPKGWHALHIFHIHLLFIHKKEKSYNFSYRYHCFFS
jgi:hypothetical protein